MTSYQLTYCLILVWVAPLKENNMTFRKLCTPKISLKSEDRLKLFLNEVDAMKIRRGRWTAEVTDIDTQVRYKLRGCACSLPHCMCDAYVVDTYPPLS